MNCGLVISFLMCIECCSVHASRQDSYSWWKICFRRWQYTVIAMIHIRCFASSIVATVQWPLKCNRKKNESILCNGLHNKATTPATVLRTKHMLFCTIGSNTNPNPYLHVIYWKRICKWKLASVAHTHNHSQTYSYIKNQKSRLTSAKQTDRYR